MARNDITVKVLGDASGFTRALSGAQHGLGSFGRVAGLAGVAIGGGLIAAGAGLAKLGEKFDDAYDTIATATGATGDTLAGLQQSFDDVLASGPSSFEDVSAAISAVNQRLDLTGQPLEDLSDQFLDLARITDTDVTTNVESMTEAFAKFGVPAEDMSGAMDEIFRASQASGIGVDELASQMARFGAPLQDLGFGFEESAALLAGFEENGINTTQVMRGMRQALGKLAEDGETGQQTLERVTDQIASIEDPAEASRLAVELFGTTAGPELATAIRSGQFDLDAYMETIANGESTISGTAAATDDWREKLATLKNRILVKLKPLAEKVFSAITDAMTLVSDWVEEHWDQIVAITRGVWEWMQTNVLPIVQAVFSGVVDAARSVVNWFASNWGSISGAIRGVFQWIVDHKAIILGALVGLVVGIGVAFAALTIGAQTAAVAEAELAVTTGIALAPFIAIAAAITAVGAGLVYAYTHFGAFRKVVDGVAKFFRDDAWPVIKAALGFIVDGAKGVVKWFQDNWDTITDVVDEVVGRVKEILQGAIDFWKNVVELFNDVIHGRWSQIWDDVKAILSSAWNYIKVIVQAAVDVLKLIIPAAWNVIKFGAQVAWDGIKALISKAWDGIKLIVSGAVGWVKDWIAGRWDVIKSKAIAMWEEIKGAIFDKWEAIKLVAQTAVNWVKQHVSDAWDSVKSTASTAWDGIKSTISGVWDDIKETVGSAVNAVVSTIGGIPASLAALAWKFVQAGANLGASLIDGLSAGISGAVGAFADIGAAVLSAVKNAVNGAIDAVNNALEFEIGFDFFGHHSFHFDPPDIPHIMHSGGWVAGRSGDEIPVILEAGEYVMSRDEAAGGRRRGDSPMRGGGPTVEVHNHNLTMTPADLDMALRHARTAA